MTDQLQRAKKSLENIKQRCLNANNPRYHQYGGRGITVCDRWRDSFQNFLDDMGLPAGRQTIDRIDNDGGYSPENCRWADYKTQAGNQRRGGTTKENAEKTSCVHGHPLSGENLYVTRRGRRHCRACQRDHIQKHRAMKRAAALTGADQAGYWECVGTVRVGKEPWNAGLSVVDLEAPVPIGTKIYTAPRHTDCALTGATT